MFFEKVEDIPSIAKNVGSAIFVVPKSTKINLKDALRLSPEEKATITIEQVRNVLAHLNVKHSSDQFVLIQPADSLGEEAENALLKNIEEPNEGLHFILITDSPSALLPTILSRCSIYFLKTPPDLNSEISCDEKIKSIAKQLIVASPSDLVNLAEQISKKKDNPRNYALEVVGATIEILYKSYFLTNKDVFLKKLPKFITLYENLTRNGHIKLHIVADLI